MRGITVPVLFAAVLALGACMAGSGAASDAGPDSLAEPGPDAADEVGQEVAGDPGPDPYAAWPDPTTVFPWVYTPDPDAPEWAHVRWETEDWEMTDGEKAAGYFAKLLNHYTTAPPEVRKHFQVQAAEGPPLGEGIVLSFSGDILPPGDNWTAFGAGVAGITQADLRVANLETAATPLHPPSHSGVPVRLNAPPEMLDHLPFDALQLNNNHTVDMDDAGAESTKVEAETRGFTTTGLDAHATVTVKGRRVALLSYSWGVNRRDYVTTHDLFIVPFGHVDEDIDLSRIGAEIAAARADGADYVVLLLHWGFEFEYYPDPHFLKLARQMVAAGADVIVGEGPHVVQPAEICWVNHPEVVPGVGTCSVRSPDGRPRRAAVLYSVGNFSNDVEDRIEVETGIVAKVSLDQDVTGLAWTPVVIRWAPPRVLPALDEAAADPELAAEIERLNGHLGPGWRVPAEAPDPDREALMSVPETEQWPIAGLSAPAWVVRTEANVPHVYAATREDLGRVVGFVLARDRYFFMELQRRYSLGTLSELLGDAGLETDMGNRLLGLASVADRLTAAVDGETRAYLEGVVAGINAAIEAMRDGRLPPPSELAIAGTFLGAKDPADLMKPFALRDLMAIGAALLFETNFRTDDVTREEKLERLATAFDGIEKADLRRDGFLADFWGAFHPIFPGNASAPGFGTDGLGRVEGRKAVARATRMPRGMLDRLARRVDRVRGGLTHDADGPYGSNAWAVAGTATATGGALVAGDGHLSLSVPALMYQIAMDTSILGHGPIHQTGMFLTPFPILAVGTNGRVAWSMVNPVVDLTDWYREEIQLDPSGAPFASRFQGEWRPLVRVDEGYVIADVPALGSVGRTEVWPRYETFDGRRLLDVEGRELAEDEVPAPGETVVNLGDRRVVPGDLDDDGVVTAVSFDYVAFDATKWPEALYRMGLADDILEYREATRGIVGGGLFMVAGDADGNVLYSSYQALPCRGYLPRVDGGFAPGAHPAFLLDGTAYGAFEIPTDAQGRADESAGASDPYRCVIPFDAMPQAMNPPAGFVWTANNEPAPIDDDGVTTNDAWYLGGPWESVRADTIRRRLEAVVATGNAGIADMASVQADRTSRLGELFTPHLLAALARGKALAGGGATTPDEQRMAALYAANAARFDEVASRLTAWTFDTPSGVETFYDHPTAQEKADAVATMIFNAWLPRLLRAVWEDEPANELFPYRADYSRVSGLLLLLNGRGAANPDGLASHDPDTGESVFFDRLGTPEVERSDELILASLAETLDWLEGPDEGPGAGGFGTEQMSQWLWGLRHQARFESLMIDVGDDPALALLVDLFSITTDTLPLAEGLGAGDPRTGLKWFPRGGDNFSVDAAEPEYTGTGFTYATGPVMRMVVALGGDHPTGQNVIPGGQSGLIDSPYFADQAALWLGNETLPMRIGVPDVVAGATGRETFLPAK